MTELTDIGHRLISEMAQRYGLSYDATLEMARSVSRGGGGMAQFNIPELGGSGQWMSGGMTMVGNMFDHGLQARVSNLCGDLANAMANNTLFEQPRTGMFTNWWPEELGSPSSVGGQNQTRYAYFPQSRRIAFDPGNGATLILLDSGDHQIGGFSQQQSGPGDPYMGITFSSQFGQFNLASLPRVDVQQPSEQPAYDVAPTTPEPEPAFVEPAPAPAIQQPAPPSGQDILGTIERLAKLRDAGALTDEEYTAKKTELLTRL